MIRDASRSSPPRTYRQRDFPASYCRREKVSTLVDVVVEGVACGDGHTLVFGLQKSTRFEERNHRDLFPADSPVVVYRWGFIHFNRSVIVTGVHMSQGSSPPTDAHRVSGQSTSSVYHRIHTGTHAHYKDLVQVKLALKGGKILPDS